MKDILYYRIVRYHQKLVGNLVPLNIYQLLVLLKTEPRNLQPEPTVNADCVSWVKLGDFVSMRIEQQHTPMEDLRSSDYPWDDLTKSIKDLGIVVPLLVEKIYVKEEPLYHILEGRHRLLALAYIEEFDPEVLVPCLILENDPFYTDYMLHKKHPGDLNV